MDASQEEGRVLIRQTTPKGLGLRPKYVMRWLTGAGIPNLGIDGSRITGLQGLTVTVGALQEKKSSVVHRLMNLPYSARKTIHVVPSHPGQGIQDSVAMVRLDFLAELLEPYIEANRDRLFGRE